MTKVKVYNQKGDVVSEEKLSEMLFSCDVSVPLVHQVVVAQQANKRHILAHTKGRSEVRGGGRKPWKQKGTGRARHGSIRSPLWKGGGVTFGPTKERNFSKDINKKMARQALCMALSDRAASEDVIVVENLSMDKKKTKIFADMIKKLPNNGKKTLLLLSKKEKEIAQLVNNLDGIQPYKADSVQALSVVTYPCLMMSKDGLQELTTTFEKKL